MQSLCLADNLIDCNARYSHSLDVRPNQLLLTYSCELDKTFDFYLNEWFTHGSLTLMITILLFDRKCISGATRTGSAAGNVQKAARSLAISVYYNLIAAYVTKLYTTMALVSAIKLESNIYNWKLASVYRQPTRGRPKNWTITQQNWAKNSNKNK